MHVAVLKLPGRDIDHGPAHVIGKVAVLGAVLGGLVGVFGWIVAGAVGLASFGGAVLFLGRNALRAIDEIQDSRANRRLTEQLRSIDDLPEVLKALPDWMRGFDERLRGIEDHLGITREASVATARELGVKYCGADEPGPPKL